MTALTLAGERFAIETARKVIAGYCFGEVDSELRLPPGDTYGLTLESWRRRRWGYLSYDCQRAETPSPNVVDIVAPVLLNVTQGYGVRLVSDLLAIAPQVRAIVATIDDAFRFWDLDPSEVAPRGDPTVRKESLALHQAWYLVESVKGADVAVTHKLLHHAWPCLFPLIDNRTIDVLGRNHAWITILEDLQRQHEAFSELESWFTGLALQRGGVALTRLRLYDVLLWCRVVDDEERHASDAGEPFV